MTQFLIYGEGSRLTASLLTSNPATLFINGVLVELAQFQVLLGLNSHSICVCEFFPIFFPNFGKKNPIILFSFL